jgi:hypothetical protein
MEPKGFHRKLTAILSADVAGYSRLMQDDEAATVKTLEAYKQIISDLVKQHRGRVVDSPGDNLLAEFASVVDAVQCAVATQKERKRQFNPILTGLADRGMMSSKNREATSWARYPEPKSSNKNAATGNSTSTGGKRRV